MNPSWSLPGYRNAKVQNGVKHATTLVTLLTKSIPSMFVREGRCLSCQQQLFH